MPCGVCWKYCYDFGGKVARLPKLETHLSHYSPLLFYLDRFMTIEDWKIGFKKSNLIGKMALLVLIRIIVKYIFTHSETTDSQENKELHQRFVICVCSVHSRFLQTEVLVIVGRNLICLWQEIKSNATKVRPLALRDIGPLRSSRFNPTSAM